MSRNSEDFLPQDPPKRRFSNYSQNSEPEMFDYADPRFYESPSQNGGAPHFSPEISLSQQSTQPFIQSPDDYVPVSLSEYKGPDSLADYAHDVGREQREAARKGEVGDGPKRKKGLAGLGGLGAIFMALLEIKWVVVLGQIGLGSITALLSIAAYSRLFGWAFAIGLVALLFIHEMGHAIVMKMKGVPIGGMIFIPMLGAAVFMRRMPRNARDEAEVGIAGPIAGALASGLCLLIANSSPDASGIWAPLAYFGFFLNLFNLIPILPLDGGRVLAAIDRRIWVVGFLVLVAVQIWEWVWLKNFSSIWLLLFIIMAASQFFLRGKTANTPEAQAYYAVPLSERIALGLAYFGLATALVLGMALAHSLMPFATTLH